MKGRVGNFGLGLYNTCQRDRLLTLGLGEKTAKFRTAVRKYFMIDTYRPMIFASARSSFVRSGLSSEMDHKVSES